MDMIQIINCYKASEPVPAGEEHECKNVTPWLSVIRFTGTDDKFFIG